MTARLATGLALLMAGCAHPVPPDAAVSLPDPLPPRPFRLPEIHEGRLSNGLPVIVVEQHETPMIWVQVSFSTGGWADPPGLEGLASVTLDMMDEGAGSLDAVGLSRSLDRMASTLSARAGLDSAAVTASCLAWNLAPTLDLVALVLRQPTFAPAEWGLLRSRRLEELKEADDQPEVIATRVLDRVLYGDAYAGRRAEEASYGRMGPADMRAFATAHLHAGNALVEVGGDTTLEAVLPLLEARLGTWQVLPPDPDPTPTVHPPTSVTLHVVDRPDAPQSVVRAGRFAGQRTDPDHWAFTLVNQALGGQFASRINMNLREDKGWTYGARSSTLVSFAPVEWVASTSVARDVTADTVREIVGEVQGLLGDRPLTEDELEFARRSFVGGWPARFEEPGTLLAQVEEIRRYGLPSTWVEDTLPGIRAVTLASADAAARRRLSADELVVVVVGDMVRIRPSLDALGWPVTVHDRRGRAVEGTP
ncbi:MAG: insulinase family protein [Deltaproteobacteria bacterium]|nr:insulinase family protein [Deltaproteobacteria bacterium]